VQELTAQGKSLQEANSLALELSANIMVYCNKAAATLMSVVMEEMLHLALSSNLKQALRGQPQLYGRSASFPTQLPGHQPKLEIDLARFSIDQLMVFLKIESPDPLPPPKGEELGVIDFTTIGDFYRAIEKCIDDNELEYNADAPQLIPGQRYYSQNAINTVYYNKEHKPQFVDAQDSGDLVHVVDRDSANKAIDQIISQGEGSKKVDGWNPDGTPNCEIVNADYDDPDREELSHFEKFAQLYCDHRDLSSKFASYGLDGNIDKYFAAKFPTNPTAANYPSTGVTGKDGTMCPDGTLPAVATLSNAVFTYLLVMIEACYRNDAGHTQYETFTLGIHKSMYFVLGSLCVELKALTYFSDGKYFNGAPTFENYPFGLLSSPKSQLLQLYYDALALQPGLSYLGVRINALPDISLPGALLK
jgi:hypothetical protein